MSTNNPFDDILIALNRIEQLLLKTLDKQGAPMETVALLSIEEASEYLNIPKTTLYQYTSQRKIPFSKPGRRLLFRKSDLDAFVACNTKNV